MRHQNDGARERLAHRYTRVAGSWLVGVVLLATGIADASILPKDSALFPKKFEMSTPTNEVDPAGNTIEWTRGSGGTFSASLSSGVLNADTSASTGSFVYWDSNTWAALSSSAAGWTVEFSVKATAYVDDLSGGGDHRVFTIFAGDGSQALLLSIGTDRTYRGLPNAATLIDSQTNSDQYHVFRFAKDGGSSVFQVWRDGIQIGVNLPQSHTVDDLYFGDGTSSFGGTGSFDYVRWDATGAYSPMVPEPASLTLLALAAAALWRRR